MDEKVLVYSVECATLVKWNKEDTFVCIKGTDYQDNRTTENMAEEPGTLRESESSRCSPKVVCLILLVFFLVLASFLYHEADLRKPITMTVQRPSGGYSLTKTTVYKKTHTEADDNRKYLGYNQTDFLLYHPPIDPSKHGKLFREVNRTSLKNLLPVPVALDASNVNDVIFVTAISSNFYPRLTLLAQSIQTFFPTRKLIVYDMGLTSIQIAKMEQWCQVILEKFHFERYPPHVRTLFSYAFKPIIIAEVMTRYNNSGVFWVDSSVRILSNNISLLYETSLRSGGVTAFSGTGHSVFAVTPPEMYDYLPMVKNAKSAPCLMATLILLYRTKPVIDHIVHWWVACALSPSCIYSFKSRFCSFKGNRWTYFAFCSRYDQSALSILLYNTFPHTEHIVAHQFNKIDMLTIQRGGSGGKVRTCINV